MLYEDGLFGGKGSTDLRREFCLLASLPERMSVTSLLEAINLFWGKAGYETLRDQVKKKAVKARPGKDCCCLVTGCISAPLVWPVLW